MEYHICIETATDICSVALFRGTHLAGIRTEQGLVHSRKAAVFIDELLRESGIQPTELKFVAVSNGPGSYTGLRVGLSLGKGMAYALEIPLITLSTIDILAAASVQQAGAKGDLHLPMIDARRMEVYTAIYDEQGRRQSPDEAVILSRQWLLERLEGQRRLVLSGNGAEKVKDLAEDLPIEWSAILCDARHMGALAMEKWSNGDFADIAYVEPNYLKDVNITRSKKTLL